jgi:hypothetical protein
MKNGIHTTDSILFNHFNEAFGTFNSELNQSIPIKSTIKIFKHISWSNSIQFTEIWQMRGFVKSWERDSLDTAARPTKYGTIIKDTVAFIPTHNLSYNSDLSTTLYGMYLMKKGRVYAFRHTLTPLVGFTYKPGINDGNYKTYFDSLQMEEVEYYFTNLNPGKTSASINMAIGNKLEMKVRKKKKDDDEDDENFKKVTLLESFSISTFYDFLKDSLRLAPISINGRTLLFKYINLSFSLQLDPYAYNDSLGKQINVTEWKKNSRLFRVSNTSWNLSCGLNINKNFFKSKKKENTTEIPAYGFKDWSVSANYVFSYNMRDNLLYYRYMSRDTSKKYTHQFNNTLNINGRIPFTDKWSLIFSSGYDFKAKQISASTFTIERDLHCWRMEFIWIPFGYARQFEFKLEAKASMLKDLKYPIKKDLGY